MIFLYPKALKKLKKVSILENNRRGFVALSDHCALVDENLTWGKNFQLEEIFFISRPPLFQRRSLRRAFRKTEVEPWKKPVLLRIFSKVCCATNKVLFPLFNIETLTNKIHHCAFWIKEPFCNVMLKTSFFLALSALHLFE